MATNKLSIAILIPYQIKNQAIFFWTQERKSKDELAGLFEFPGGKVEKGESLIDACLREVEEETEVKLTGSSLEFFKTYTDFNKVLISVYLFHDTKDHFSTRGYKHLEYLREKNAQIPPNNKIILAELSEYFQRFRA